MRTLEFHYVFLAVIFSTVFASVTMGGTPTMTAFTYQGQLKLSGLPVSDTCDLEFSLWDNDNDPDPGNQIGTTVPLTALVHNGLFQVELDFGSTAFNGDARWLQVDVCCVSPCAPTFVSLTPRQPITSAPYAVQTRGLFVDDDGNVNIGTDSPDTGPNPATKLYLEGAGYPGAFMTLNANGGNFDTGLHFRNDGALRWQIFNLASNDSFNLRNSAFQPVLVTAQNGNVGIGTSTPSRKLQIGDAGIANSEGMIRLESRSGTQGSHRIWDIGVPETDADSSGEGYSFIIDDTQSGSGAEFMIKFGSGNVGIGTDSPSSETKLHVVAGVDDFGILVDSVGASGSEIGLHSGPIGYASLVKNAFFAPGWTRFDETKGAFLQEIDPGGGVRFNVAPPDTGFVNWNTSLFLSAQGNVGIGTDTPSTKLHVVGDVTAAGDVSASGVVRSGSLISLDGTVATGKIRALSNLEIIISDERSLLIASGVTSPNLIGGSSANARAPGISGVTIAGGGSQGAERNVVWDHFGTIGGGSSNVAGVAETPSDPTTATHATVGGGHMNQAQGLSATVAGGENNVAMGESATVPGGDGNAANGDFSFAAGKGATADHVGSFVWSDSLSNVASTGDNQFIISADGGVGIGLNNPTNELSVAGSADFSGFVGVGDSTPDARLDVERRFSLLNPSGSVAIFNRTGLDGHIIDFQQDGRVEGWVSVSGNTVTYSGFTGSHVAWTNETLERSALVRLTGINRRLGALPGSEIVYGITQSTKPNDPQLLGAYLGPDSSNDAKHSKNNHIVMAVGNGDMCVIDTGEIIHPGDYLISSSVPGCAMKHDPKQFPVGYIVARAAEGMDFTNINADKFGVKRKRLSVFFESFVLHAEAEHFADAIATQAREISSLRSRITRLEDLLNRSNPGGAR